MSESASPKPHYLGHRGRIKRKFRAGSLDGWLEHEIAEFILTYTIPRKDTKKLAKALLARFKTLNGILDAGTEELQSVKGISEHSAILFKLMREVSKRYIKDAVLGADVVSSPETAVAYLKSSLKGSPDEEFQALFLNSANRVLGVKTLQSGTVNRSAVYPRKIAEAALRLHATGVIIAHNHPGGTLKPSEEDRKATEAVRHALKTLDVSLLDHIIISDAGHFSWKEHNLL